MPSLPRFKPCSSPHSHIPLRGLWEMTLPRYFAVDAAAGGSCKHWPWIYIFTITAEIGVSQSFTGRLCFSRKGPGDPEQRIPGALHGPWEQSILKLRPQGEPQCQLRRILAISG